jgi:ubiquinone/menaquinone biosynthesis C-methylase UbiE
MRLWLFSNNMKEETDFMQMQISPTDEIMADYEEIADIETASEDYAGRFSGKVGQYFLQVQSKIILDLLKTYTNATVLEVGGGHAQVAPALIDNGYQVTVTGSADICRKRLDLFLPPDTFEYRTCDMLNLPFKDNHFDVVMAFRLLPHVGQWQQLLREMSRVAKSAVIFDYPDKRSFNFLYYLLFEAKKKIEMNTRPFALFEREEISQCLMQNGFDHFAIKPQFFVPMVIHRLLGSIRFSKATEFCFRTLGITHLFGSPIIFKAERFDSASRS